MQDKHTPAFVISVDGKLVSDLILLKQFSLSGEKLSLTPLTEKEIKELQEFRVIIIPLILGGEEGVTLSGKMGDFLKKPLSFELTSKRVRKGVCYLRYSSLGDMLTE